MNKEIIVDEVDVSNCPKYVTSEAFNLRKAMGENVCINCAGVECLFKKYELLKIQNQQQYIEFKNKEINYEEQIRQLRLLNKELQGCLKEDLTNLCVQNEEVLNEIENHLTSFLNMQNSDVNEINTGFNAGAKTVARIVLNIIEKANNEQDRRENKKS